MLPRHHDRTRRPFVRSPRGSLEQTSRMESGTISRKRGSTNGSALPPPLCPLNCCNSPCTNTSIRGPRCLLSGQERPPLSRLFARQSAVRRYGVAPGHDGEIAGRPLRDPSSPSSKCNSTTWMPLLAAILRLGHAASARHDGGKVRLKQLSTHAPQANLRSDSDRN